MNILALAYLGDSVYELYIRNYLLQKGIAKVNSLQKQAIKFVSAKSQSKYVTYMIDNDLLKSDELDVYYRGRNAKSNSKPKNTDIITYKIATGFEAIIGDLYNKKEVKRIEELINIIITLYESEES